MWKELIIWYCDNQTDVLWTIIVGLVLFIVYLLIPIKDDKKVDRPRLFSFEFSKKISNGEKRMLVYSISVGAVVDEDVVERRMTTEVNGAVVENQSYAFDVVSFGEKSFNDGDKVKLSLVDVDDVGNVSEPAIVEFVAADTLPPSSPNGFGVTLVREDFNDPQSGV